MTCLSIYYLEWESVVMSDTVIVALLGLAGILFTGTLGYVKFFLERDRRSQAELEMRFQRAALSFPEFVEEWHEISSDMISLMQETTVDRFLLLRAWNGHLEPRWTTALYQIRANGQKPIAYVHYELDTDYVGMLRQVTAKGNVHFKTTELPVDAVLRKTYEYEKVTEAAIFHLTSHVGPMPDSKAHTYCSFATHSKDGMTEEAVTRCHILASRMKGLALTFDERPI